MRIYVGNFGYETREQELREAFEAHGQVQEVHMVRDRDTDRPKGFAFVEMPTSAEAQAAIGALNGKEFGGRAVTVNEARPRQERGSGGGGADGYGNRGGSGRGFVSRLGPWAGSRSGPDGIHNASKHSDRNPRW